MDIPSIMCPTCGSAVEPTNHIFFACSMARGLSRKIFTWWDINPSEISSYEEWLNWVSSIQLSSNRKELLEGVFYVMWWLVWSFRNTSIFGSKSPSKAVLFDDIVARSFYWCRYRSKANFSWVDWLKNPYLVTL